MLIWWLFTLLLLVDIGFLYCFCTSFKVNMDRYKNKDEVMPI